jgi:23S rRNA pseudouridine2605 synthase
MDLVRLNKLIADAGVTSRRGADELIADGRVMVDGLVIRELGAKFDPQKSNVMVDGETITQSLTKTYLALHKPKGVLSTMFDPEGRPCLSDFIDLRAERLFHVGRLDKDSEGLLIITNDGILANKIMHPSGGIVKRYEVTLNRAYDPSLTPKLLKGAKDEDELLRFTKVIQDPSVPERIEIHLNQGRKREIRRLLEIFGFHVKVLRRFQVGGLVLRKMPPGDCRQLSQKEIASIFEEA